MGIDSIVIIILIAAELGVSLYPYYKRWRTPDLKCDLCGTVRRLYKTKDRLYWCCHRCKELYNKEL